MKNNPKKKHSVIGRVLILLVSVYLLYSLGDLHMQFTAENNELGELEKQKQEMQMKIAELERLLDEGTEAEIIEKAARERLGYVYSDEIVFTDISGNT